MSPFLLITSIIHYLTYSLKLSIVYLLIVMCYNKGTQVMTCGSCKVLAKTEQPLWYAGIFTVFALSEYCNDNRTNFLFLKFSSMSGIAHLFI